MSFRPIRKRLVFNGLESWKLYKWLSKEFPMPKNKRVKIINPLVKYNYGMEGNYIKETDYKTCEGKGFYHLISFDNGTEYLYSSEDFKIKE